MTPRLATFTVFAINGAMMGTWVAHIPWLQDHLGISMEFADRLAYERYNEHPDHVTFVQDRWLSEVGEFLELDYTAR